MRAFAILALLTCAGAAYNPRPFVLSVGDGACIATMYSPQFALTTEACSVRVLAGASVRAGEETLNAQVVPLGGPLAALKVDPPMGSFAALGYVDPFVSGELVSWSNGEYVSTPVSASAADRGPAAFAVTPSGGGCPRTDGAALFSETRRFGSATWLDVPLVAVVDASSSSCVTFTAIPVAPYMDKLSELLGVTVDQKGDEHGGHVHRRDAERYNTFETMFVVFIALGILAACISPLCLYWT